MIEICCCCSNVNVENIKTIVAEDQLKVGCIGNCEMHKDKSYGLINGEMVVTENENDFIEAVKAASQSSL